MYSLVITIVLKYYNAAFFLLLYSQAQIRQTDGIVMMSKEGSTKPVNFMTKRAGILVRECGHNSYIVKMP